MADTTLKPQFWIGCRPEVPLAVGSVWAADVDEIYKLDADGAWQRMQDADFPPHELEQINEWRSCRAVLRSAPARCQVEVVSYDGRGEHDVGPCGLPLPCPHHEPADAGWSNYHG